MKLRPFILVHSLLFLLIASFSIQPWPSIMLTIAQIVYIPIVLQLVSKQQDWLNRLYYYFSIPAYGAVAFLQWTDQTSWDGWVAAIYFLFTIMVAIYGVSRFLQRGFVHLEEFSIDLGLIYLAMGGAWFWAYEAGWNTGFSAILTWLTAIHFHYSAFLLPIFIGFLGRQAKSTAYRWISPLLLVSPLIVAIGITFARWIELLSVLLYIIGIGGLIFLAFRCALQNLWQKLLVRLSFLSLAVTISFSLLYAYGNISHLFIVNIDFMLRFHGLLNCVVFALFGVVGWSLHVPSQKTSSSAFPISQIRGGLVIGEKLMEIIKNDRNGPSYRGLVDDMRVYGVNKQALSPTIIDFYERTIDYRLSAKINWSSWFKPLAALYRIWSKCMQQINLPIHHREIEMTGGIWGIRKDLDGRTAPRAWLRKIEDEIVFVALYSEHRTNERNYMNIALPLPWSAMTGILDVKPLGSGLQLTSKKDQQQSDAGIYLTWKKYVFKLPLEECFHIEEVQTGELRAKHKMWIFGLPFLKIDYKIKQK
ncbi:YndJ family protein [Bacillus sp. SD088]|uniref:YndJ family protein n=1 Tax=Bacillus sp. SD088 TaxID=2782012 RepID=UPI001A96B9A3|nr:YndJ family protein [Bacillus sp. SD088]MBO0992103.1 YndJ family protein [Bacillus sp. SD088]